ncbi:MAG: PAS domain-containing protein [Candidatus Bathyarchaeota archaeon]|nr:PAS domain-containing protein [Candidatus Bathyarchaeota archaeon]
MGKQQARKTFTQLYDNTLIVGIGASAGGLDALKRLLENLPINTGLAIVIIQHLMPNQESMLPEILSRFTKMVVQKVENNLKIKPNKIYVIPSGKTMTLKANTLKLQPKDASLKPIDIFFISLAQEKQTHAIGIVLSGTGNDGTLGLKSIKDQGGITFAQDLKSAQYPDMPKNAIDAETVYFTLTPENIAAELTKIAKHPEIFYQKKTHKKLIKLQDPNSIQTIFMLLETSFGVDFSNYKRSTIQRRISRRIMLTKNEDLSKYMAYIKTNRNELQALFEDLLIGVTNFFREPKTFMALKEKVFSSLIEKKPPNKPIRIWVPGCSTGEEVYSMAIAIQEFFEEKTVVNMQIQIFGTDINNKNIEKARKGIYPKSIVEVISEYRLKRFFIPTDGNYQIKKQIRDMCIFAKHDLTKDPPFSNMDLITCRNLLIYFDLQLQERTLLNFNYGLRPEGYLVLGASESIGKFTNLFFPIAKKDGIFQKKNAYQNGVLKQEVFPLLRIGRPFNQPKLESGALLEKEVDVLLNSEYVPASMLLNDNLDVLVFRGKIDPYLFIAPGTASLNVKNIIRKDLKVVVQTAVYKVKKTKKEVEEIVQIKNGEQKLTVNIRVKLVEFPKYGTEFFLVLIEESNKTIVSRKTSKLKGTQDEEKYTKDQIITLNEDLELTKQTLQTVIEQQEATNEELHSSMEELQSSNEELMSTNEELETAKEELQSTNEELETLNDELKNRNQNLSSLNDDLTNLMLNIDSAVVIVDNTFKVRRFNSSAESLLRLMPSDINNTIVNLRLGIPISNFEMTLKRALNLEAIREEIQTGHYQWYQMRIRPYLTQEKKVDGLVISFTDISELKLLEDKLKVISSFTRHDVKGKLMVIRGNLYLAQKKVKDNSELKKYFEQIPEEISKIERILDISKFYDLLGRQNLDFIDVGKSFDEAASQFVNLKGLKIVNDAKGFKVLADQTLSTLFANLIDNTLKYGEKATLIRFYIKKQSEDSISIVYEDDGVGISDEYKKRLFDKGVGKGSGYGLFLIKRSCGINGWTITEEGEVGKGVKFVINIAITNKSGKNNYQSAQ